MTLCQLSGGSGRLHEADLASCIKKAEGRSLKGNRESPTPRNQGICLKLYIGVPGVI